MADASGGDPRVHNLTVEDVARGLTEGRMLLVDVREPNEVEVEAYPDAVVVPLSVFDPAADSGSARQAGRVRLSLGTAIGHGVARGAGEGLSLQLPSGRRHPGLESRRAADRKLGRTAGPLHTPRVIACA